MNPELKQIIENIKQVTESNQLTPPRDVEKVLHYGIIDSGAGNDATCFNTWLFAGGDIRYLASYYYNILWFIQCEKSFTLDQLKELAHDFVKQPAEFCNYCGFLQLWELTNDMFRGLEFVHTKEELFDLVDAMWGFQLNMDAWVYHYIPWGAGYLFPTRDANYFEEGLRYARMK